MINTRRAAGTVRMGPISIFSLVIALCVAVLAVLTVSTTHANHALANRQSEYLQADYTNERAGQIMLAELDDAIAELSASGASLSSTLSVLDSELPTLCAEAEADAATTGNASDAAQPSERASADANAPTTAVSATREGALITVTCTSSVGRQLSIKVEVTSSLTVEVLAWQSTTPWVEPEQPQLWTNAN